MAEQVARAGGDQREGQQVASAVLEHATNAALEARCTAVEGTVEPAKEAFFLVMGIALG